MSRADAVSRSTPNGFDVSFFTASISETISSGDMVEAPRHPNPPASDTAATRREYETPPMPASITGCSTSRTSVRRVRKGMADNVDTVLGGGPRERRWSRLPWHLCPRRRVPRWVRRALIAVISVLGVAVVVVGAWAVDLRVHRDKV